MDESFRPIPRNCDRPSGKHEQRERPLPWTLPLRDQTEHPPTRVVTCFACRKETTVPEYAISAKCSFCSSYIMLDDVMLHNRTHRTVVRTWGDVTVPINADLKRMSIECNNLILLGKISGKIVCHGVCKIKSSQTIRGEIRCEKFIVKKKACVTVSDGIQAGEAHIHGSLEGRLNTVGKVFIYPNGKILGDLHAKELIVQEGGIHKGTFDRIART